MKKKILIAAGILIILILAIVSLRNAPSADQAPRRTNDRYTITELDKNLGAGWGIGSGFIHLNDQGTIAGFIYDRSNRPQAVSLSPTGRNKSYKITQLGNLTPEISSYSLGINNQNKVIGQSGLRNFEWTAPNKLRELLLNTSGVLTLTGTNDKNQIIGAIRTDDGQYRSVRYTNNKDAKEIDSSPSYSSPSSINNNGDVVGVSNGEAYLYTDQTGLRKLGNWVPKAINNKGTAVGYRQAGIPYVYTPQDGVKEIPHGGGTSSSWYHWLYPEDINDNGVMVGTTPTGRAFVSDQVGKNPEDLEKLVTLPKDTRFVSALDINNKGQIIVYAYKHLNTPFGGSGGYSSRFFLLTPNPSARITPTPSIRPTISPSVRPSLVPSPGPGTLMPSPSPSPRAR